MTSEPAIVTALDGAHAWVQTHAKSACGSCGVSSCGGAVLGSLAGSKVRRYRVRNDAGAAVGEEVSIAVPDGAVLRASLLGYLLPLGGLVTGAMVTAAAGWGDALVAVGAVAGAVLTGLLARTATDRAVRRFQPFLIRTAHGAARPIVLHLEPGDLT